MPSKRRLRARPARVVLGWSVVGLVFLHCILTALVGWGPPEFHDPLYGEKLDRLHGRLAQQPADIPLILILGSSRALTGLNARLLEQRLSERQPCPALVYNFAVPGGGPVTELLLLRRLLDAGIRPATVILEMSPTFFAEPAVSENLKWLESHGVGLAERRWLAAYGPLGDPRTATTTSGLLLPWFRHRFALVRCLARGFMPTIPWGVLSPWFDDAGWEPIGAERRDDTMYARFVAGERAALAPYFASTDVALPSSHIIDELLTLLSERQIRTLLTVLPEASDLRGWCPEKFRRQSADALQAAAQRHGFAVIDGHDWLGDDDFFDPIHMIVPGANRFTERLAASIGGPHLASPLQETSRR